MTPLDLLETARAAGIILEARGDRLHVDAPAGAVTPALRDALVTHKADVLDLLRPRFVTLNGGLTLPVAALALALDLERRGIPLATDDDHHFIIPADARLTADDHAAIARWRHHLGAIVEYRAPEIQ